MRHWKLITGVVVVIVLAGAVAALALSTSLGESAAGDVRTGPASAAVAKVTMHDNSFDPVAVTVPAGSPVEIEVQNAGQVSHNFTSQDLKVSTGPMQAGDVKTVTLTVPQGTTRFVCTWHDGMVIDVTGN